MFPPLPFPQELTIEKEVIDGVVPFFREKPHDVALVEGAPLVLKCRIAADPKPAVSWLKNDLLFMDDSREGGRGREIRSGKGAFLSDRHMYTQ